MKIVVINGTEIKGCTYHTKEEFLKPLRGENVVIEYYLPKDMPHFCCGCKICIMLGTDKCPHTQAVTPIYNAMLDADLLVKEEPLSVDNKHWLEQGWITIKRGNNNGRAKEI